MDRAERAELMEAVIDNLATDLIPALNRIADKQVTTNRPASCEVDRCYRAAGYRAWATYFLEPTDAAPFTDERVLCKTHAELYAVKFEARTLTVAGRPVINYTRKWGIK